jgi:membrane-associated phospholipid phosphatase
MAHVSDAPDQGADRFDSSCARARPAHHGQSRPILIAVLAVVGGYIAMAAVVTGIGEVVVHAGFLGGLRRWDDTVASSLADHRNDVLNAVTAVLSRAADTTGIVGLALVILVILLISRRWWALLLVPVGLALEFGTFLTANALVGRDRPDVTRLGSEPSTSSFPSGHTAATIVVWGAIVLLFVPTARRGWRAAGWVFVILVTTAVGTARVYRGMHHPTDVMAGALMGAAALAVAALVVWIVASSRATDRADVDESDVDGERPRVLRAVS